MICLLTGSLIKRQKWLNNISLICCMVITYSVKTKKFTKDDYESSCRLAESFFQTKEDPEQMSADELTFDFFTNKFPYSGNIIKDDNKVIGHTFALPCNKEVMNKFLRGKINEKELFYEIRDQIKPHEYDSLYLVSAQILPGYQRRGLATNGFVMQVRAYQKMMGQCIELFYWSITPEGNKLAQKVAAKLNLPLKKRIN